MDLRPWGKTPPGSRTIRPEVRAPSDVGRLIEAAGGLGRAPLVVLANREPYVHERAGDGSITVRRPPGGLVTGIEPLLRACGGTWIAHGSGSADVETAAPDGTVAVPPGKPSYTLQRIFLSDREVDRYYSGFANEALWPLCHRAHVRPIFRYEDWSAYRDVNRRFADAAVAAGPDSPILVQDYHFALVPQRIRERNSAAVVGLFWHIPWPEPEMFGICPWSRNLIEGLLGSDVIGFHTDDDGRCFLESASRLLGREVDWEERAVMHRGYRTLVRTYPISVEWPFPAAGRDEGVRLRRELGIDADIHVSVAVDRADYTKGLVERVLAVETLLDGAPHLARRYVLVQLAAPSRQRIGRYRHVMQELRDEVARVNQRFERGSWQPIVLRDQGASPAEVRRYYAMADSALVTPLHDGMNLVAKEYVASCTDDRGTLVLSRFAGAARELRDALIVNPYDVRDVAAAILRAVEMPVPERTLRMRSLRSAVARNTIYDWSANLLTDLRRVRTARAGRKEDHELLHARGA
ncbi:MAG TPA: trehalose-6-phosphate synthase [Thermoanaerobaculia bacterium]|nr:trehalose-6-phosphate synthase [Thermoanaerobaculia bacterium]